jgi:cation:H+ antiporter
VGVLFIAAATSLPELATSLGALKIGAYDMIVGNIFGSNMFNIFVIFFADVSFRRGRLLGEGGGDQVMVASLGILLTSLAILGMGQRSGKFSTLIKQTLTWLILAAYLIGIYILYLRGVEF